jgi:hypothetical protein
MRSKTGISGQELQENFICLVRLLNGILLVEIGQVGIVTAPTAPGDWVGTTEFWPQTQGYIGNSLV